MADEAESLVGHLLAGTYQVERLLVEGGMATVYAGRHIRTFGPCAIKVLTRESVKSSEIYERFQDEARISCTLRHPNIVQVMDLNQTDEGRPFMVLELLEGEDLQDRLDREGALPLEPALVVARQVGSALNAAHGQQVVHRDLKPQNIFLSRSEIDGYAIETAKVLDFGLSKIRRPKERETRNLMVLGTPRYMAPEGALGLNSEIDGRADQFSLAVILYRMLSGRLAFDASDVAEVLHQVAYEQPPPLAALCPHLPKHVIYAIERALSKNKEDRFPTMLDFIEALSGVGATPTFVTVRPTTQRTKVVIAPTDETNPRGAPPQVMSRTSPMLIPQLSPDPDEEPRLKWWRAALSAAAGAVLCLPLLFFLFLRGVHSGRNTQSAGDVVAHEGRERGRDEAYGGGAGEILTRPAPAMGPMVSEQVARLLREAEEERGGIRCGRYYERVIQALRLAPRHPEALRMRWQLCGETSLREPYRTLRLGYPPLRLSEDDAGGAQELEAPRLVFGQAEQLIERAQDLHDRGEHGKAIEVARAVVSVGAGEGRRAYRVVGAAACAMGRLPLVAMAHQQLDAFSQEFLDVSCRLGSSQSH